MMSKKPKQSRHRVPTLMIESEPVTDEYQAEVDTSMERLERRYRKAQKALQAAELKAERARLHGVALATKQAEAEVIAANRIAEESRLTEYIERIRLAAKNARVGQARADLELKQQEAIQRRDAATNKRKAEAKERRDREELIKRSRANFTSLESAAAEHRREVREIEQLMMPGNYAGQSHRGTGTARHNSGRCT